MLSHMTDCQIFGLNPAMHHLHNLLLHLVTIVLVFLFFYTVTGDYWKSLFVAALFALHPLNVESVAWVTGRKNMLSTVFFLLSMLMYVSYLKQKDLLGYILVFVCYMLGLAAKGSVITLIFTLLLLDIWPFYRFVLRKNPDDTIDFRPFDTHSLWVILEKVPFLIVTGLILYFDFTRASFSHEATTMAVVPLTLRLSNAVVAYLVYVFQVFFPYPLSVHYPYPTSIPLLKTVVAFVVFIGLNGYAFLSIKRRPAVFVGWFWFVGNLVMVSGLIQGGLWPAHADRFMYVPAIGLFMIAAWGVPELTQRKQAMILACLFCTFLTGMTFAQVRYWKNSVALYTHALAVHPDDMVSMVNLAFALDKEGKGDQAISYYQAILARYPQYAEAHSNLGVIYAEKGNDDDALMQFEAAAKLQPMSETVWYNQGLIHERRSQNDTAMDCFKRAITANPKSYRAYINAASLCEKEKRFADAIGYLNGALALKPDNPDLLCHEAELYSLSGDDDHSETLYNQVFSQYPTHVKALEGLTTLLIRKKEYKKAAAVYEKALINNPEDGLSIGYNLACVYAMDMNTEKALFYLRKIIDNGFTRMDIIKHDDQLKNIRETDGYKTLIHETP
jgi:tetratricopeptide (TPR) repeat protein